MYLDMFRPICIQNLSSFWLGGVEAYLNNDFVTSYLFGHVPAARRNVWMRLLHTRMRACMCPSHLSLCLKHTFSVCMHQDLHTYLLEL